MLSRRALIYMGERLVLIGFTAVAVSSIVFLMVHQLPGNAFLSDRRIDPAALAAIMHHYHLDLPLFDQYKLFVAGILRGDLGESVRNQQPVLDLVWQKLPVTLELTAVTAPCGRFTIVKENPRRVRLALAS